jgi:hypothetical protein
LPIGETLTNCNDPRHPASLETVIDAFKAEREYQRRRWGFRQLDGVLREADHDVADFLVYMDDYLMECKHEASRKAGKGAALDTLRKVICLAIACLQQNCGLDGERLYDQIRCSIANEYLNKTVNGCIISISRLLSQAFCGVDVGDTANLELRSIVIAGVSCFMDHGIVPRDISGGVINGRDGLPA